MAAARRRCANCGGSLRARDRFCGSCGTRIDAVAASPAFVPSPAPSRLDTAVSRPAGATESASLQIAGVAAAALGEQRKVVTILFADLSGSTVLGERLDPEELRGVYTSFFNELARQIKRYEGTVDKYIGDAVMAVFGAPISHEDDAERAINAGLAMQASIAQLNDGLERRHGARLALRIGINTGEVVAGLLGGDVQAAYTVVGDAVNTAQRYEAAAPPGEILVSATTRRLAIHSFEFEQTAPLTLKGKAERVVAYRVLRRRYEEIAPEASPFVGRERELQLLRDAVVDAVEGRGRVVDVVGEAGVGKSRLVGELRAGLVAGIDRITVRCTSFETNTPYGLVAHFVRAAFSIHAADDEETASGAIATGFAALGQPLDDATLALLLGVLGYDDRSAFDPETKRRVIVNILRTLLRLAAARAPFVLTAEDLHWVDEASLRVLEALVADVPSLPCLFIGTARPGWRESWESQRIELLPLDEHDARALVEEVLEASVDDELANAVIARTAGNPFFVEEVVRELQGSGLLVETSGRVALRAGATARVPDTIQELIEARLDRLPPHPRRVLDLGAVCGRTFWSRVLERLVPEIDVATQLRSLESDTFIVQRARSPELTYAFRQVLIQEVAYQTQLQATRRVTHASVAAAIEALYASRLDEFVDFLAYHYERSDDRAKAAAWLLRAGDRALRLYAAREAQAYYTSALERADDPVSRALAHEGIGDVRRLRGEYRDAVETYERALDAIADGDAVAGARIMRKLGIVRRLLGDSGAALARFELALARLGERSDPERARILLEIGQLRWQEGRYDEAIRTLGEALAAADAADAPDARAETLKQIGTVYVVKGDDGLALEHYGRSADLFRSLGDVLGEANVLNNIGIVHRKEGRYDDALAAHRRALATRERVGEPLGVGTSHNNIAQIERARGDFAAALRDYRLALETWERIGYRQGVAIARTGLGITLVESGSAREGREALSAALGEWEQLGSRSYLSEAQRYMAAAWLPDDAPRAREWAERAVATSRETRSSEQEALALQVLGRVLSRAGDDAAAADALERSRSLLAGSSERQEYARTLAALSVERARLGAPAAEVRELRQEAEAILKSLGVPAGLPDDDLGIARDVAPTS